MLKSANNNAMFNNIMSHKDTKNSGWYITQSIYKNRQGIVC